MENKNKNKKDIVSYRNKHYIAIAAVICITVAQAFSLEGIWKILVYAGFAFVVGALVGTYEEKDELTNATLLRATELTFFFILATLFLLPLFIENVGVPYNITESEFITDILYYILFGSIGIRSAIFLCLDIIPTLKTDDEEVEEEEEEIEEELPALEEKEEKSETIDIEKLKEELKAQLREELKEEFKNESKVEEVVEETVEETVEEAVEENVEAEISEEVEENKEEAMEEVPKPKTAKTKKARKN